MLLLMVVLVCLHTSKIFLHYINSTFEIVYVYV